MNTIYGLLLAAVSIAATTAPAFAQDAQDKAGHYEWRYTPKPGPNKSNLPNYRRVWVADAASNMATKGGQCVNMPCCQPRSGKA